MTNEREAGRSHPPETVPSHPAAADPERDAPTPPGSQHEADSPPDAGAAGGGAPGGDSAFELRLDVFQGPLDLLLYLIERNELDITEVSLLQVTEQYMEHLRSGERVNVAALAEFIAVGARLLLLKSRALLAADEETHESEPDADASDLLDALREYRRFKEAAGYLRERDGGFTTYRREAVPPKVMLPTGLDRVTLDSLTEVLREVLARMPEESVEEVQREPVRLHDRVASLVGALQRDGRVSFRRLIESAPSRTVVIVDFLAVLELIKARYLAARQSESFGDIQLVRIEGAEVPDIATLSEDFTGA